MIGAFKPLLQLVCFLLAIPENFCMMYFQSSKLVRICLEIRRWGQDKGNYESP